MPLFQHEDPWLVNQDVVGASVGALLLRVAPELNLGTDLPWLLLNAPAFSRLVKVGVSFD